MKHRWVGLRLQAWMAAGLITVAATLGLSSTSASAATGPNLALGRPAVASSVQSSGTPAAGAADGSLSTRWSSAFSDPQWIYVDLGATYKVNEVVLNWETAFAKAYQVQVSSDAVNWTTIYSTSSGSGGVNDLTGLSGTGRYVRMYGTQRGTVWGYSLWEMSVYGTPTTTASSNLALGRPAVASSVQSSGTPAAGAADGSLSTRWSSAFSDPQWIYVDLGATYKVNEVVLNWETAFAKAYQVQVSSDAVNWTTIYSTSSGSGGVNDLTGLSGTGRYVRMYGTQRGTVWGYSLWELSVYGALAAAAAPDTTPPSTPTNLSVTAGDGQASLSWSAPTDPDGPVAGYYIFRNGTRVGSATGTSYTDTGLTDGTSYGYYVEAYDAAGNVSSPPSTVTVTPVAPPAVAAHIDTWALDDCGQGSTTAASLVRQWVSFAETNCGPNATKANNDCHAGGVTYCKTLNYVDPNWQWSVGGLTWSAGVANAASESWWLHQPGYADSAHRLAPSCFGGVGYLIDQNVVAADQWFRDYVRTNFAGWDGTFMDDTNGGTSQQFYNCAAPAYESSQEITSDTQLQSAHQLMANTMTNADGSARFQVDNGEQANPNLAKMNTLLDNPASVHGLEEEGDPWDSGFASFYSSLLDDMAYVNNHYPDGYFLLLHPYDSSGSAQGRRVSVATTLLGYSRGHTVLQEDMYNGVGTDLAVWPEEGIYANGPVQTMSAPGGSGCEAGTGVICSTGGHNDLKMTSGTNANDAGAGVYRREFTSCSNQGVSFGRCAVIVNDTSSPVTVQAAWLTQSYGHQITFTGGDVQSGGTLNLMGAGFTAGSTTIPANDAVLLAQ